MLDKKDEQLLKLLENGGTDKELIILDEINSLEEKFAQTKEDLTAKFNETIKEIKDNIPDLNKVLSSVKGAKGDQGDKGDKGDKITQQDIVNVVKPLLSAIKLPTPIVNVASPNITVQPAEVIIPDTMQVEGMVDLIENTKPRKDYKILDEISSDNPLPVILTDEKGNFYKAVEKVTQAIQNMGPGGGPDVVGIKNGSDVRINPATEGTLLGVKTAVEATISGSEMQVDVVAALPAGTNAIGKLLPSDVDVTTNTNHADKYYTNAGAVTDGIIWSPAAGKRWHITTLYLNVSAAATVTIEDDLAGGDVVRWKGELAANSGVVIPYSAEHPMASGEDAADLIITTSAGNVYVQAVGFEI